MIHCLLSNSTAHLTYISRCGGGRVIYLLSIIKHYLTSKYYLFCLFPCFFANPAAATAAAAGAAVFLRRRRRWWQWFSSGGIREFSFFIFRWRISSSLRRQWRVIWIDVMSFYIWYGMSNVLHYNCIICNICISYSISLFQSVQPLQCFNVCMQRTLGLFPLSLSPIHLFHLSLSLSHMIIRIYSICHSLSTTFISYVSISLSHQFRVRRFTLRFSQPFSSLSLSHPAVFHLSLSLFHQFRVRQVPIRFWINL